MPLPTSSARRTVAGALALVLLSSLVQSAAAADEPAVEPAPLGLSGLPDADLVGRVVPLGALWSTPTTLALAGDTSHVTSFEVSTRGLNGVGDPRTFTATDTIPPFDLRWTASEHHDPGRIGLIANATLDDGSVVQVAARTLIGSARPTLTVWPGSRNHPDTHLLDLRSSSVHSSWELTTSPHTGGYRRAETWLDGRSVGVLESIRPSWEPSFGSTPSLGSTVDLGMKAGSTHTWRTTVTDWAGWTTTSSAIFVVDHAIGWSPLIVTDSSGRRITPSTWVLSGTELRVRGTVSTSPAWSEPIDSWSMWSSEGNGQNQLAGVNHPADAARYACLGRGGTTSCGSSITFDRPWTAQWAWQSVGSVDATAISQSQEARASATYRVYPAAQVISLAPSTSTVNEGAAVSLRARLVRLQPGTPNGAGPAFTGEKLTLERCTAGATTWTAVGTYTIGGSDRTARATVRPSSTASYRWRHADRVGVAGPATSPVRTVSVRPVVTTRVKTAAPSTRRATVVQLTSSVPVKGGTIVLQRKAGSSWKSVATARQDAKGRASVSVRLPAGKVKIRAVVSATSKSVRAVSSTRVVRVAR